MTDRLPVHDDDLVELLREACARHDAAPAFVVEGAKAAFDLRSLDDELAALTNDTLLDTPLVGVRGQTSRQLTFTSGDLAVEVDIDAWGVVGHVSSDISSCRRVEGGTHRREGGQDSDGASAQAPLRSHRPTGACTNRTSLTWPTGRFKGTANGPADRRVRPGERDPAHSLPADDRRPRSSSLPIGVPCPG